MNKKSTISERISQYLDLQGVNANEFAKKLGYNRSQVIYDIINGRSKPSFDFFERVYNSEFAELNQKWLITGEGPMTNDVNSMMVSEPETIYISGNDREEGDKEVEEFTNKNGNKFYIYPNGKMEAEVPLMTEPAYATYAEQYFDDTYVKELPKEVFEVDKIGKGNYMAFTIKNNSMWNGGEFDTQGGTPVLAREIGNHLWPKFHKSDYGFILMTRDGIFHKDIKGYDDATGNVLLGSRNPDHEDFEININYVNKIFSVIKRGKPSGNKRGPLTEHLSLSGITHSLGNTEKEPTYKQEYVNTLLSIIEDKEKIIKLLEQKISLIDEMPKKPDEMHK